MSGNIKINDYQKKVEENKFQLLLIELQKTNRVLFNRLDKINFIVDKVTSINDRLTLLEMSLKKNLEEDVLFNVTNTNEEVAEDE